MPKVTSAWGSGRGEQWVIQQRDGSPGPGFMSKREEGAAQPPGLFLFLHPSFMDSALGASSGERRYGETQMCVGHKAGSVLVPPCLAMQKVLQVELPLPPVMGESWEGSEGAGICSWCWQLLSGVWLGSLYLGEQHLRQVVSFKTRIKPTVSHSELLKLQLYVHPLPLKATTKHGLLL